MNRPYKGIYLSLNDRLPSRLLSLCMIIFMYSQVHINAHLNDAKRVSSSRMDERMVEDAWVYGSTGVVRVGWFGESAHSRLIRGTVDSIIIYIQTYYIGTCRRPYPATRDRGLWFKHIEIWIVEQTSSFDRHPQIPCVYKSNWYLGCEQSNPKCGRHGRVLQKSAFMLLL